MVLGLEKSLKFCCTNDVELYTFLFPKLGAYSDCLKLAYFWIFNIFFSCCWNSVLGVLIFESKTAEDLKEFT